MCCRIILPCFSIFLAHRDSFHQRDKSSHYSLFIMVKQKRNTTALFRCAICAASLRTTYAQTRKGYLIKPWNIQDKTLSFTLSNTFFEYLRFATQPAPWSVVLEKLTVTELVSKFHFLLRNTNAVDRVHKMPPLRCAQNPQTHTPQCAR